MRSQVDLAISNEFSTIQSFFIKDKLIHSDHCALQITCSASLRPDVTIVRECSEGISHYASYDINRRIKSPLNLLRINITNAMTALDELANKLKVQIQQLSIDEDLMCAEIAGRQH